MTEKQTFTKENLSALLRLQADALDRGEVLEFEEGGLISVATRTQIQNSYCIDGCWADSITIKTKPQLRKATAMEWLEWACSDKCIGWAVKYNGNDRAPSHYAYLAHNIDQIDKFQRAKFENGKLGEFDHFWKEV